MRVRLSYRHRRLAGLPAIGFLHLVKLVLDTPAARAAPAPATDPRPAIEPVSAVPANTVGSLLVEVPVVQPVAVGPAVLPVPEGTFSRVNGMKVVTSK